MILGIIYDNIILLSYFDFCYYFHCFLLISFNTVVIVAVSWSFLWFCSHRLSTRRPKIFSWRCRCSKHGQYGWYNDLWSYNVFCVTFKTFLYRSYTYRSRIRTSQFTVYYTMEYFLIVAVCAGLCRGRIHLYLAQFYFHFYTHDIYDINKQESINIEREFVYRSFNSYIIMLSLIFSFIGVTILFVALPIYFVLSLFLFLDATSTEQLYFYSCCLNNFSNGSPLTVSQSF